VQIGGVIRPRRFQRPHLDSWIARRIEIHDENSPVVSTSRQNVVQACPRHRSGSRSAGAYWKGGLDQWDALIGSWTMSAV
jgi:hypothetical protein